MAENIKSPDTRSIGRKVLCALHLCETFKTKGDDDGLWGECELCGRRVGYISSAELRACGERAMAQREPPRDRPAANPGGLLCESCGEVFIGEEWHRLCGRCQAEVEVEARLPREPRWHWRNCRALCLRFDLHVWPWHITAGRFDDVYGGEMGFHLGPIGVVLYYDIGNASSEGLDRHTALHETEAYDRAEKWKRRQ